MRTDEAVRYLKLARDMDRVDARLGRAFGLPDWDWSNVND